MVLEGIFELYFRGYVSVNREEIVPFRHNEQYKQSQFLLEVLSILQK